jgi:creatinine amidohydrolase/Fe(II)-dependent formamide hydrolase-like protein
MLQPTRTTLLFVLALALTGVGPAAAQVLHLAEMTADEIEDLDRSTAVIIVPGGILEQHGPHLPSFSDGYINRAIADSLAAAIDRQSGWTAVMFPMIPLGTGGANEIGGHHVWPGTYAVRSETLRAIFMDLATEFGEQGFEWVFLVHVHGSPWHNRALDEAGDYFRDTYDGRMVNLTGIRIDWGAVAEAGAAVTTPDVLAEDANSVHAGLLETSQVLYLRPDLVSSDVGTVPSVPAPMREMMGVAADSAWAGYFGAPRHATAAFGEATLETEIEAWVDVALSILGGADEREMRRTADLMLAAPPIQAMRADVAAYDSTVEARQREWLRQHAQK